MFVKKLVEKATKKPGEYSDGLKPEDVDPRLAFHYGLPPSAAMFAYDPIQKILAVATMNGQIKLLGKDNTQALLESNDVQPSKFLQFIHNQGILLNVTSNDQIEVWDIDKKILSHVHNFDEEITSMSVMQLSSFIFIGDRAGNVTVWKLDNELGQIEKMKYWIPFSASHAYPDKNSADYAVKYILPQPTAESRRILIIFADGLITLWAIQESKAVSTMGGSGAMTLMSSQETKRVTSACWVCPFGSKVSVGYDTGDILIHSIPSNSDISNGSLVSRDTSNTQIVQTSKINLVYRLEKIPIASLKWVYSDGKPNRLYVTGASDAASPNLVQVVLLNEDTESRTIKVGLQLPESCLDIEIISRSNEQSKHKQKFLILLGKSGLMYAYDDHSIEKCLLQSQSKPSASLPNELMIKLPISASTTTAAQFITNQSNNIDYEEDYMSVVKNFPSVLPSEAKNTSSPHFTGFAKIKNLYITGHSDGTINFWDVTCPLLIPLLSLTQQNEDDSSQSGVAVTAIHYCSASRLLISGDKSGMVRIYQMKSEPFSTETGFFSLSGSSKKGNSHVIHSVKFIKVNGSVLSFHLYNSSRYLAVGSEQGHVSVINVEGSSMLHQKKIGTELSSDVISVKFESSALHGFEKNVLVIATKDSSLLAIDADTGNTLSSSVVHPKKPSKALFMQTLEASRGSSTEETAQKHQLLLCSEKAVYIYSLPHIVQGVKKVLYKKKFNSSSCYWASTICSTSSTGLVLFFSCGKIEIRSLPDLSLVKETTLRSFICSPLKPNTLPDYSICSSADGEVIMMRSDQEVALASMFLQNGKYRHLDSLSRVYDKNLSIMEDGATSPSVQKKKGMFGTIFKDVAGSKTNHGADTEVTDGKAISEDLSKNFAVSNFPTQEETSANVTVEKDNDDLDIDDIDIDDQDDKPKGNNVMGLLNKQKFASKFNTFKGKLKQMTNKNEKPSAHEEPQSEKVETVDQIKKRYGFSSANTSNEPVGVAKMIENKLTENVKKLQGINLRTTEMQDNAQTFSSMARETLRIAEQKNSPSKT
ncbi:uncharacterized protein LOC110690403 isoform X2 [Chenopodium quinoa]|uniref:uncharacterized protein LOC110690403 isoform X2 n=1 Tax=Chenopodium quinoa TaxID=63459 RepID=UPI000B76F065|nr:uncharacterized protein LOC110690403 isoform X2 [Chenopodium quinoa]